MGDAYEKPRSFSVVMGKERGVRTAEEPKIIIESESTTAGLDVTNSAQINFYKDSTNSTYYNDTLDFGPSHMMKFQ